MNLPWETQKAFALLLLILLFLPMSSPLCPDTIPQVCVSGEVLHVGYNPDKFKDFSQIKISFRGLSVVRKEKKKLLLTSKKWIRAAFWLDSRTSTGDSVCTVHNCACKAKQQICISFPLPRNLPSSYTSVMDGIEVCYQIDFKGKLLPTSPLIKLASSKDSEPFLEFKQKVLVFSCMRLSGQDWQTNRKKHSQAGAMGRSVMDTISASNDSEHLPYNTDGITIEMVSVTEKSSCFFGEDIRLRLFIDNDSEATINSLTLSLVQDLTYNDQEIDLREKQQEVWKKQLKQWKKTGTLPATPESEHDPLTADDPNSKHKITTEINRITLTDKFPIEPGKTFSDASLLFPLQDYSSSFAPTIRGVPLFRIDYFIQAVLHFQEEKAVSPISRLPLQIFVLGSATEIPKEKDTAELFQQSGQLDPVIAGREKDMESLCREFLIPEPRVQQYYANAITTTTTASS